MKTVQHTAAEDVRRRLVEVGGRTSQDIGLGRIVGQIVVYLYLKDGECSLDQIGEDLGLSKAAVSVAARQLENLGLIRRSWKKGDRKTYYRTADNIATALQQGLLSFVGQKIQAVATELDYVNDVLEKEVQGKPADPEAEFVYGRVKRAKLLRDRAASLLNSPLLRMFVKP
jgi:DNA-binding transcriptional regulator GbsR (MarR family)